MSDLSVHKQVLERFQADGEKALKKGSELLDSLEVKRQDKIMKSFYDMISNIKGVLCTCLFDEEITQDLFGSLNVSAAVRVCYRAVIGMMLTDRPQLRFMTKEDRVEGEKNEDLYDTLLLLLIEVLRDTLDELTPKSESAQDNSN
jgi:hypothetical protein